MNTTTQQIESEKCGCPTDIMDDCFCETCDTDTSEYGSHCKSCKTAKGHPEDEN